MLKDRTIEIKENVKNHIKRNKDAYYVCTIVVAVGVTVIITRRVTKTTTIINSIAPVFHNNVVTDTSMGGHLKKIVRNNDTGIIWESVNAAAYGEGCHPSTMSRHLNGHIDAIYGERYSIIGVGN